MTGDKSKFMSVSGKQSRNVTFGNDLPRKIKEKGMVMLKSQDVLFVDGIK